MIAYGFPCIVMGEIPSLQTFSFAIPFDSIVIDDWIQPVVDFVLEHVGE